MVPEVFIVRHGIMCGVQKKFSNVSFGQEFHGEPVIKEADGIMPGSGVKGRKTGRSFSESEAVSIYRS